MSRRTERVGEQVRGEIARLLRAEVTDPRIGLVTITRVDVSPDFANAVVFWSPLGASDEAQVEAAGRGLASAAGFLRSGLARALRLRRVPELRFRHDPSLALGARTLELLRSLEPEGAHGADDGS